MASFTNEQIIKFYMASNFNKTKTAKMMKCSRENLYKNYIALRPELQEMLIAAEETRLDVAEEALVKMVKSKNFQATKFMLETKGRKRGYGAKVELTHIDQSSEILRALERKYEDDL